MKAQTRARAASLPEDAHATASDVLGDFDEDEDESLRNTSYADLFALAAHEAATKHAVRPCPSRASGNWRRGGSIG